MRQRRLRSSACQLREYAAVLHEVECHGQRLQPRERVTQPPKCTPSLAHTRRSKSAGQGKREAVEAALTRQLARALCVCTHMRAGAAAHATQRGRHLEKVQTYRPSQYAPLLRQHAVHQRLRASHVCVRQQPTRFTCSLGASGAYSMPP